MRLSKSLYASGVLNNGKVPHCNEWDLGAYKSSKDTASRLVQHAQMRWNPAQETKPEPSPSLWKTFKNVLRIG